MVAERQTRLRVAEEEHAGRSIACWRFFEAPVSLSMETYIRQPKQLHRRLGPSRSTRLLRFVRLDHLVRVIAGTRLGRWSGKPFH